MKNKIFGIFVCMLVMTAAVVSATGIMNIATPTKVDKDVSTDTIEKESNEKPLIIEEQDDGDPPQPLATKKTGYLSIPPAAFTSEWTGDEYVNKGYILDEGYKFISPVYLPNASIVTNLTLYWRDNSGPNNVVVRLYVNYMNNNTDEMAVTHSGHGSGDGWSSDDTIDYAKIDNKVHSYYLLLAIEQEHTTGCFGVVIEYTYTSGVSSENMVDGEESQVPNMVIK